MSSVLFKTIDRWVTKRPLVRARMTVISWQGEPSGQKRVSAHVCNFPVIPHSNSNTSMEYARLYTFYLPVRLLSYALQFA